MKRRSKIRSQIKSHKNRKRTRANRAARRITQHLRLLERRGQDIVYRYRLHPQRRFEYVSPAVTDITGYTPAEHYADPDLGFKILLPEDRAVLDRLAADPAAFSGPVRLRCLHKAGHVIWTEHQMTPVRSRSGQVVALEGVARDVTGHKQIEEALDSSSDRFAQVLSSLDQAAYEVRIGTDPVRGKVVFVSRQSETIFGHPPEALTAFPELWFQSLHRDDVPAVVAATQRLIDEGKPVTRVYRLRHGRTGQYRWVEDRAVPQRDASGRVVGYYGAARDITELKRANDVLQAITEKVAGVTGEGFLRSMVTALSRNLGVAYAFVSEVDAVETAMVRTVAAARDGQVAEDFAYPLEGTPCADVVRDRQPLVVPSQVLTRYPKDVLAAELKLESYAGVPLSWADGRFAGLLVISDREPLEDVEFVQSVLEAFAARVGAELERRRTERVLRESEARLHLVLEQFPAILWTTDRDLRLTTSVGAGLAGLGLVPGQAVGMTLPEYFDTTDPASLPIVMHRRALGGETVSYEGSWMGRTYQSAAVPFRAANGEIVGVIGAALDITERKEIEEAVRASREQLRALSVHLETVREAERARIAREVHDQLGQALTALKMDLTWCGERLPQSDPAMRARCAAMLELVSSTIVSVREITTRLRPPILDDLGLIAALEWLVQDFAQRAGLRWRIALPEREPEVEASVATGVFRIVQEALTNVGRHARAATVELEAAEHEDKLVLHVRDDGRGIAPDEVRSIQSVGLIGMRERARALGGSLRVEPGTGGGTDVTLEVPLMAGTGHAEVV